MFLVVDLVTGLLNVSSKKIFATITLRKKLAKDIKINI